MNKFWKGFTAVGLRKGGSGQARDPDGKFASGAEKEGFKVGGTADLKAQGFSPMKRGDGADKTHAARVAWQHASVTGKPATVAITAYGWSVITGNQSVAVGQPHMVVTPEGKLTAYNPKSLVE